MDKAITEKSEEDLIETLCTFKCAKDLDIEQFLHTKAIQFLRRRWCSIYLILNEEQLLQNEIKIEAYFTLSHKTIIKPEEISKNTIKKISGFTGAEALQFVLIGQLGKHIEARDDGTCYASEITSSEILSYALEVIEQSSELIPCKCVLVECSDNEKIWKTYTDYGFKYLQFDEEHYQFYKILD